MCNHYLNHLIQSCTSKGQSNIRHHLLGECMFTWHNPNQVKLIIQRHSKQLTYMVHMGAPTQ